MDVKNILKIIESNLTGDSDKDHQYLVNQIKSYQALDGGDEVIKGIVDIIKKNLSQEEKESLINKAKSNIDRRKQMFKDTLKIIAKGDYQEAKSRLNFLIQSSPVVILNTNNDENKAYEFNNLFESLLFFTQIQQVKEKIQPLNEPLASFYYNYAYTLCHLNEKEKALVEIDHTLLYNPVHIGAKILKSELLLQTKDLNLFYDSIMEALHVAYTPGEIGRCYWLLGDYFGTIKQKPESIACYLFAKEYISNDLLEKNLHIVEKYPGEPVVFNTREDLLHFLTMIGIPTSPSNEVLATIKLGIDKAVEKNDEKLVNYFMNIGYKLTKDSIYQVSENKIVQ